MALLSAFVAAGVAAVIAVPATSAAAASTTDIGTAYSAAVQIAPGSGATASISTGGAVGLLLSYLQPVLDQTLTPLSTAVNNLATTMVSDLGTVVGNGFTATAPGTPQSPPASGYPSCADAGWNVGDCFGPVIPLVASAPTISLGSGTVQGYAAADANAAYGKARTTDVAMTALGVNLGDLGVAEATSKCPTNGACTGTTTLTGMNLLGGAVAVRTGSSGSLEVSLNHSSFAAVTTYSSATALSGTGLASASAQVSGSRLKITIGLTLSQLQSALGLSTLLPTNAIDVGSTASLTVVVGTGGTATSGGATAGAIEVGLGLKADIRISVLGLVTATLSVADATSSGNLLDLQLAYSTAGSAPPTTPTKIEAQLI